MATQGDSAGAVVLAGQIHEVAVRSVPVNDTVGAGDSFMAGRWWTEVDLLTLTFN